VTNTVDYFNTILIVAVKCFKALAKGHTQRSKIPNPAHRHLNFHRQEIEADQPTTTGFYDTNKHRYINRQIKACFKHIQTFGPASASRHGQGTDIYISNRRLWPSDQDSF
jgi:hypothetical protein